MRIMKNMKVCNVFISSPGDLIKEREHIAEIVNQIQKPDIMFQAIRWEKNLPTTSLSSPQTLINETLLDTADILIGIFSKRFGTKTENSDSGTVEEIETFIAKGKPVILYFYNQNISTNSLSTDELENLLKIKEFKEKYKTNHIYKDIDRIEDLQTAINKDIDFNISKIHAISSNRNDTSPKNINKNSSKNSKRNTQKTRNNKNSIKTKKPWYMDSIAVLINEYLEKKGVNFHYRDYLTFHENTIFLTGTTNYTAFVERQLLDSARIEAFNHKYGNYDYSEDLRSLYPTWAKSIYELILKLKPDFNESNTRILDVGGNDGSELESIFTNQENIALTVVDLSNTAVYKGKNKYSNIDFVQGDMEQEYLNNYPLYDICLCLRSIQSRGVFSHDAMIQMCKHLKDDGAIIISIPNGYKHNNIIERGLYDHRSKMFVRNKPQNLAFKIEKKLIDYGFSETGCYTIETEIILWGKGRKTND